MQVCSISIEVFITVPAPKIPLLPFSKANKTWLPVSKCHLKRAGEDQTKILGSVYNEYSNFLKWRKSQPAIMNANNMANLTGGEKQIVFDRKSDKQILRCIFDFEQLTAKFKEL